MLLKETKGFTVRQRLYCTLCVMSQQEDLTLIPSPDFTMTFTSSIIQIMLFTSHCAVRTAFELPPGNSALSVVAEASFVYIVWLIACKEHNEFLMSCASDPAATVCTVNVIRDSASCPWWARSAVVFTCAFSIFCNVGQCGPLYVDRLGHACEWFTSRYD